MTKLDERTLLDDWFATGTEYEDFKETLKELSDVTSFVKVNPMEVSVMSLKSVSEEKAAFWELNPWNAGAPQGILHVKNLAFKKVLEKGNHARLLSDTLNGVKMLFMSEGRVFFPAEKVLSRGLVQFGAGGSAMCKASYERDLYISALFKDARKSTFVVREIAGAKKLVSILSAKYKAFPQSALCEIIDAIEAGDFGKMDTYSWTVDNWTSNIYVEFPEKAEELREYYDLKDEFVPGLWLQTSDTGDASVKIFPTWRRGRSIVYVEKAAVKRAHSGKVELSELLANVKAKAFAEYTRLPEAMCNLMMQNLTDPAWDLTNPKNVEKNRKLIESVIKKAFKTLNITKAIGKGNKKELMEQLCAEFSGAVAYTAYDVASAIMSLPERLVGVHKLTLHNLESAVSEAPYIKYSAGKMEEESELILA